MPTADDQWEVCELRLVHPWRCFSPFVHRCVLEATARGPGGRYTVARRRVPVRTYFAGLPAGDARVRAARDALVAELIASGWERPPDGGDKGGGGALRFRRRARAGQAVPLRGE